MEGYMMQHSGSITGLTLTPDHEESIRVKQICGF
jgi:hypothetical protein